MLPSVILLVWLIPRHVSNGETILCNSGFGACANSTQQCVEENECTINCDANEGCAYATLRCKSGENCAIYAARRRACLNSRIYCPHNGECDITGSGGTQNFVYRNSEIVCGNNGICRFLFNSGISQNSFQFKYIDARNSSYLYLKREGYVTITDSLVGSNVFCPSSKPNNGGNVGNGGGSGSGSGGGRAKPSLPKDTCFLDCLKSGGNYVNNSCSWLIVYAKNGFNDLYINDSTNNVNITLYCGNDFSSHCNIISPNIKQCDGYNGTHPCDYVEPTMYPSQIPTIIPTHKPSFLPTNNPSINININPSFNPTYIPSSIPSNAPIIATTNVCKN